MRVSDKPADADHQYGHGKFENFSAFIETGLLLLTCFYIVYEAIKRLFFHHVEIEPSLAAFVVMFISIAVDYWRSRALGKLPRNTIARRCKRMLCTFRPTSGRAQS